MTRVSLLFLAAVVSSAIALGQSSPMPEPAPQPSQAQVAHPDVPVTSDEQQAMLAVDLKALSRIVGIAKEPESHRDLILALVDDDIEKLREPKGDGTYRYASLQRIEAGRVSEEKGLEKVFTEQSTETISVNAANTYRLVVSVPEKRNLISRNNRVYIRNAVIEWTGFNGKTTRTETAVNTWIDPNDSYGIAIPEIAKNAQATVEVGVESGSKKAVAQVHLLQAKLVDDPRSPYFPAIQRLQSIRQRAAAKNIARGELLSTIDESILNVPGEMQKRVAALAAAEETRKKLAASGEMKGNVEIGDATPDVVSALSSILDLTSGSLEEQGKARENLETLVKSLKPAETAVPEEATKPQ